jgi:hypothetical protein
MVVHRKGIHLRLAGALLLPATLVFAACDDNDPVEPYSESGRSAPEATASTASIAGGAERSATVSNAYVDRLTDVQVDLTDNRVEILSIPELPAGEYVITGKVAATNYDTGSYSYVVCHLESDGFRVGTSVSHLQQSIPGGVNDTRTLPLAGHVTVDSGSARLSVECNRAGRVGSPAIRGDARRTQLIAMRVGDA